MRKLTYLKPCLIHLGSIVHDMCGNGNSAARSGTLISCNTTGSSATGDCFLGGGGSPGACQTGSTNAYCANGGHAGTGSCLTGTNVVVGCVSGTHP